MPYFLLGDRYDAEPRMKSKFEPTSSRYDEDPRGPVRPYTDDDDDDEKPSSRNKHNSNSSDNKDKDEDQG